MSEWIKCSERLPRINTRVACAYESDDGEGNFKYDFGECAMNSDGDFLGVGIFYAPQNGTGVNGLSIQLTKLPVKFWMERKDMEQPK